MDTQNFSKINSSRFPTSYYSPISLIFTIFQAMIIYDHPQTKTQWLFSVQTNVTVYRSSLWEQLDNITVHI